MQYHIDEENNVIQILDLTTNSYKKSFAEIGRLILALPQPDEINIKKY